MRSNDVDVIGISNGIEKPANSRVSFKDMLLGASRDTGKSVIGQDNDDLQLLDGDVTTGTKDGLPSIHFSDRIHQILYQVFNHGQNPSPLPSHSHPTWLLGFDFREFLVFLYWQSILKSIGETIGQVIKLDVNTGNAQRGRFVRMAIFLDLNNPLVSKIKVDGCIRHAKYESLPNICFSCGHFGHFKDSCSSVPNCVTALGEMNQENLISDENRKDLDMFGPWMVVNRRNKNWDPNSHSVDANLAVSLSSSKIGNLKRFKNGSHNLRGPGNKFKVKAFGRDSVAKAMTKFVDRIGLEGLMAKISEKKLGSFTA
ncbi:hypothetical protein PVK06_017800 [Gossypium arboreum]|uniref:CCHC-type domain-containing protein n=1 Tax=Gossypium arboreum TaxID=29729 RepID=A0ABR0Q3M6_GOSAR|nr:hypothetical protein PVK06_017800 [Gossypium arboreum]